MHTKHQDHQIPKADEAGGCGAMSEWRDLLLRMCGKNVTVFGSHLLRLGRLPVGVME